MRKGDCQPFPGNSSDPQGMAVLRDRYLEFLAVKNLSPWTVRARLIGINIFIAWGEQRGVVQPSEVSRAIVERFQRWLFYYRKKDGEPLSVICQYGRLSSIKLWFQWLAKQRYILYNPAGELEMPKLKFRLPKHILSVSEAEQVMAMPDIKELLGLRDRAILETLYSTGIRRAELVNLHTYDIDAERGIMVVRQGKGQKDRTIPIGERALAWIDRYLQEVRPRLVVGDQSGDMLFLTNLGEPFHPIRLSAMIRSYVVASDVGKEGSCHLFRHTCATLMLEGGADIRFIQAMLGHAKLESTQVYAQVSIRKLKEIHTATHPAKLKRPLRRFATGDPGDGPVTRPHDDATEPPQPNGSP